MRWSILLIRNSETKKKDIFSDTKGQNARWKQEDEQKEITSRLMHYPE
jgi:hypothetical protein